MIKDRFVGSKNGSGVWQQIISQMPPHEVYIEPFLGGGAVMLHKRPAILNIGVESDAGVAEAFPAASIPSCKVINGDGIQYLRERRCRICDLVYADPPYVMSTRSCQSGYYRNEWDDQDHLRLLEVVKSLPCYVILSGYWSELYANELTDWRTYAFWTVKRNGKRVQEWLWMNYPEPFELHDYRFIGVNFRERERIKRKKERWKNRLETMVPLERAVIISAINDVRISETAMQSFVIKSVTNEK